MGWIASCRGWLVEDGSEEWNAEAVETHTKDEGKVWAVRTLERNMTRFLGLVDDPL